MKELQQKFLCAATIVEPDKLVLLSQNIKTSKLVEEIVTIEDRALLDATYDIIHFPLKEYAHGFYKNSVSLKEIAESTMLQAKEQLDSQAQYEQQKKQERKAGDR
jgi:hypothetical protein